MTQTGSGGSGIGESGIMWLAAAAIAIGMAITATGCASSGTAGPPPVKLTPDNNGIMVDFWGNPIQWTRQNPGKAVAGLVAAAGAWKIADHNDYFRSGRRGRASQNTTTGSGHVFHATDGSVIHYTHIQHAPAVAPVSEGE